MLWQRTWLETRQRLFIVAAALGALTVLGVVLFQYSQAGALPRPFRAFAWELLYRRGLFLSWPILAFVLGAIGIASESTCRWKRQGVAGAQHYLLTLPVSRWKLLSSRLTVVLAQIFALAILQPVLLFSLAFLIGQRYPLPDMAAAMLLLAGSGAACASFGLLLTLMFGSETTAIIVGYCALFLVNFFLFFARQLLATPPRMTQATLLFASLLILAAMQAGQARQVLIKKDY